MELKSERTILEPMCSNDLEIFHSTNTNAFVREYLWDNKIIPKTLSIDILKEVENRFEKERWGLWKILNAKNGEYMGYAGFWCFFGEKQPQLLYALLPSFTGMGYATEASQKLVRYAFDKLKFKYLIAAMDKPNRPSIEVGKKLNMKFVEEKEIEGKPTVFYRLEDSLAV